MANKKLLVINPNSSQSMTDSLQTLIQRLNTFVQIDTYTAPSGPPSINNEADAVKSANVVIADPNFLHRLHDYDAYLVACYSVHPLVKKLQAKVPSHVHVTGIFEASIITVLSLLPGDDRGMSKFGIVSTGTYWEKALSDGVQQFLGPEQREQLRKFKGVETTGLNAIELHTADVDDVERKMKDATKRLVRDRDVGVVCLGCAGMVGMDKLAAEALREELGDEAKNVHVLDGVEAGIALLVEKLRTDIAEGNAG